MNRAWIRGLRPDAAACVAALMLVLTACGGGGGGAGASPPPTQTTPTPTPEPVPVVPAPGATSVILQSEAGDPIGQGANYSYSRANAELAVTLNGKVLSVAVVGDEDWSGEFQLPDNVDWKPARFDDVAIYKPSVPNVTSMRWYGGGRGCTTSRGTFSIDQVDRADSYGLRSLILKFTRYCDGAVGALKGEIRFQVNDATTPPEVGMAPASLWRPPEGAVPATGNYVYLASAAGDVVGLARTRLFTPADSRIFGAGSGDFFNVSLVGAQTWYGILSGRKAARLTAGYYAELVRYPFANPTRGGLTWTGEGRGCRDSRGWAVIDRIEYESALPGSAVKAIEYRFEQTCVGATGALRGAVRWAAETPPVRTPASPAGAWQPPAAALPASGSHAYLSGSAGDVLTQGRTALFTPLDSTFVVTEAQGKVVLDIHGDDRWFLSLRSAANGGALAPGVYDALPRMSGVGDEPHFEASTNSRGCGKAQSWVAIDEVQYMAGQLTALDFRFELRCDDAPGLVRGRVAWRAEDRRLPTGPGSDVPTLLWRPQSGSVPADARSYLRVESSRADFIGGGLSATYSRANAGMTLTSTGNLLRLEVAGDQAWSADFVGTAGQDRLLPGFYAGVIGHPFHNPARGGMAVSSDARAGNSAIGWFVVDRIDYSAAGAVTDLQLRFEQHVEGSLPGGLWGELRWAAADTTQPPGPVAPPAGLWQPTGAPASGSHLHFESAGGDFIGANATQTLTATHARLALVQNKSGATATFTADVGTVFPWTAEFKVMSSLTRLQPGFYGGISGHRFQNPAKGGLSFSGDGRGCNVVDGWFVVDDVRYVGEEIASLKLRFEQVCEGRGVLHGQIHWNP